MKKCPLHVFVLEILIGGLIKNSFRKSVISFLWFIFQVRLLEKKYYVALLTDYKIGSIVSSFNCERKTADLHCMIMQEMTQFLTKLQIAEVKYFSYSLDIYVFPHL